VQRIYGGVAIGRFEIADLTGILKTQALGHNLLREPFGLTHAAELHGKIMRVQDSGTIMPPLADGQHTQVKAVLQACTFLSSKAFR
jgi:hypothetical protein